MPIASQALLRVKHLSPPWKLYHYRVTVTPFYRWGTWGWEQLRTWPGLQSVKSRLTYKPTPPALLIHSTFTLSWLWAVLDQPEGIALDKSGQLQRNLRKPRWWPLVGKVFITSSGRLKACTYHLSSSWLFLLKYISENTERYACYWWREGKLRVREGKQLLRRRWGGERQRWEQDNERKQENGKGRESIVWLSGGGWGSQHLFIFLRKEEKRYSEKLGKLEKRWKSEEI